MHQPGVWQTFSLELLPVKYVAHAPTSKNVRTKPQHFIMRRVQKKFIHDFKKASTRVVRMCDVIYKALFKHRYFSVQDFDQLAWQKFEDHLHFVWRAGHNIPTGFCPADFRRRSATDVTAQSDFGSFLDQ